MAQPTNQVLIFHERGGMPVKQTKVQQRKADQALAKFGGNVAWVADKCVAFIFPTQIQAYGFKNECEKIGLDVEMDGE